MSFKRFAYYLLIVSITVSCITNCIFAKFTSEDAGKDSARVSKFGIVLNVADDLFANTYNSVEHTENPNGPATFIEASGGDTISVQASAKVSLQERHTIWDIYYGLQ